MRYPPLRDYAILGDGRTIALVGLDGAIDWLCLPDVDSSSTFGALLDRDRGGSFWLRPVDPFTAERRYIRHTNVLETTFRTEQGVVRVTEALTLPDGTLAPFRELARRVEGVSGCVTLEWRLDPRFNYGRHPARFVDRGGVPMAQSGSLSVALCAWNAGAPVFGGRQVGATFTLRQGERAMLALVSADGEPAVFPSLDEVEGRLDTTATFWKTWCDARTYDGPWKEAVLRSALVLKLLIHAPSGAIAAAATTSLPEQIGGERNWDYRFCWIRDAAFTLEALLSLGCVDEARSFFWWFTHATQSTRPRIQVLYRLDGGARVKESTLDLEGYLGSRPVRIGNGAVEQFQLDVYGDLFRAIGLYAKATGSLDWENGGELSKVADLVCQIWRQPDSGIWEVRSEPRQFTQSKVMCWVALDRAIALADQGLLPSSHVSWWRREAAEICRFIDTECWSGRRQSYVRFAGGDELDASLLDLPGAGFGREDRIKRTICAIRQTLSDGPFVYRYRGEDGIRGKEGAFLTCSFWLVEALARTGQREAACTLMERLLPMANDVGLYSEEIDPATGAFLGNLPQALVHLSLINAAVVIAERMEA